MQHKTLIALAITTLSVACGESPTATSECSESTNCADAPCTGSDCDDSGTDITSVPDAEDTDVADASEDASSDSQADEGVDTGCEGDFLCPCAEDNDCELGFCIDYAGDRVCTVPCVDTCPEPDWECRLLQDSGGDLVSICVPPDESLCIACETDLDCGGLSDLCLELGDGEFCGASCEETGCPEGYLCEPVIRNGEESLQCTPEFGVCSSCVDADDDGYGLGAECLGSDCNDLVNSVFQGAPELCDGLDNDCDDSADESFDLNTSLEHCGSCGSVCAPANAADFVCAEGLCEYECGLGYADCNDDPADGCEQVIDTSLEHCGACNATCAFEAGIARCEAGVCLLDACRPSFGDCDGELANGCETNVAESSVHCGSCGTTCTFSNATGACTEGACELVDCFEGFADCNGSLEDGCEAELAVDVAHCGACGTACAFEAGIAQCDAGVCLLDTCRPDFGDCDADAALNGCETDLTESLDHCGSCGTACTFPNAIGACSEGTCELGDCLEGFANCNGVLEDGCEAELAVDLTHCGACGLDCEEPNAVSMCASGACSVVECAPGWVDLDGDLSNGCDYECTFFLEDDQPDNGFLDADCDGVDGNIEDSIFVNSGGDDRNDGLTPDAAVATLARGLELAEVVRRSQVLLNDGPFTGEELVLPDGVSLYGGYSRDFRTRGETPTQYNATAGRALLISGMTTRVNIDRMRFATENQSGGEWTAALRIISSGENVFISHSEIFSGNGGDGAAGVAGSDGTDGAGGANASGSNGGVGGASVSGTRGGNGGDGERKEQGVAGDTGESSSVADGGPGGNGSGGSGMGCADGDAPAGGNAVNGANGPDGPSGSRGGGTGVVVGGNWTPDNGRDGNAGGDAGAGGGGGAGGGEDCEVCAFGECVCAYCGTGRGGGGGGGGGTGGSGGARGNNGGASIGVLVVSSELSLNNTIISSGRGGHGGAGGRGGSGGGGASGGSGVTSSDGTQGAGGDGGDGGNGGNGGCGGGGGGGPSVGIWLAASGNLTLGDGNAISNEDGGNGGASCGDGGEAGTPSPCWSPDGSVEACE